MDALAARVGLAPDSLAALAASCPPAWVFVVLALPHLWYMCVSLVPFGLALRGPAHRSPRRRRARACWALLPRCRQPRARH
jgi:hypothetical protein